MTGRLLLLLGLTILPRLVGAQPNSPPAGNTATPAAAAAAGHTGAGMTSKSLSDSNRDRWYFQTSVITKHFRPNPQHDNTQRLLNLEYWRADSYLAGLALFDNSFGQRSQYLYLGRVWRPFDSHPSAYLKLTGGVLHGYKGEFKDKIPFNRAGTAPALVPSIGYGWGRLNTELVLFGTAGMLINFGVFF